MAFTTRKMANHAGDQVELSRVGIERAHRPVVVPASSTREVSDRTGKVENATAGPAMHDGQLVIALENVGMGPAFNVRGIAEPGGNATICGTARTLHPVEGIGAGRANASRLSPGRRRTHVHVHRSGSFAEQRNRLHRDYLRADPVRAREYAEFK